MLEKILVKEIVGPIVVIFSCFLVYCIIKKIIKRMMTIKLAKVDQRRQKTINVLILNIIKYFLIIIAIIIILSIYGVNMNAVVASLGAVGVVVGLAFQDILKDFLSGLSVILEDQYAVGDTVSINDFKGTVIEFGLRTTKIKAFTGEVKSIGNSSFSEVINYNLADCDIFLKLNVAYDTDIDKLEKVLAGMKEDILKIDNVKDYKLLGVDEFGSSSIVYIVDITCKAMTNFAIKREVLKMIKKVFDKEGINIPYTTVDINVRK